MDAAINDKAGLSNCSNAWHVDVLGIDDFGNE
jgi:hypothetical protein